MRNEHLVIVPGGLNTDIIGLGVEKILHPGELTIGGKLRIGPGGKARNMAQMAAAFLGKGRVAMIGRSSKDPFGLWKVPIQALQEDGVDTTHVKVLDFEEAGQKYPGIALIPVDKEGTNQIYVLPGVNEDFSRQDVNSAEALFANGEDKILMLALEIPLDTARHCIDLAAKKGMRILLDPGGITSPADDILDDRIFLITPNVYEVNFLTGVEVTDFTSAMKASQILLSKGVRNILMTLGAKGAYFFNNLVNIHLPCPAVPDSEVQDETGCGDQVTATVAACLAEGKDLMQSVSLGILAGTMQFYREGIQPVTRQQLDSFLNKARR